MQHWQSLVTDLSEGAQLSIPRSYFHGTNEEIQSVTLCGFCDASTQAYAAVAYLRVSFESGTVVKFVVSKTRVSPLQSQTIPRLELLSAFLLARLIVSVAESLAPPFPQLQIRCYTDSLVALYWIRGITRTWKVFVQNRVDQIRRNVHPSLWSHCPGKSNPADLPLRGLTVMEISVNQLWREGPRWLKESIISPTIDPNDDNIPDECTQELRKTTTNSISLAATEAGSTIEDLITCRDYSSYTRLLRVTAQVLRAVKRFKHEGCGSTDPSTTLTPEELVEAETLWIRSAQQQFTHEKTFQTQQRNLRLFKDDKGIWRCGGRLSNVEASFAVKHPILLPRAHDRTRQDPTQTCVDGGYPSLPPANAAHH